MGDSTGPGLEFATKLTSLAEAPEPLRGSLDRVLGPGDNIRCLIFSPMQTAASKVAPASVVAILDDEWVVAVYGLGGEPEVHRCNFAATLLVELSEILLYGRLRLSFVEHGRVSTIEIYFNTVTDWLYREALELLLPGTGNGRQETGDVAHNSDRAIEALPIKFRNGIHRYLPAGEEVRDFVYWQATVERRWLLFLRERVPQGVLLLTNTQLLLISEERAWWRGKWSESAKYGYVVTYCPLSRIADIQLRAHQAHSVVDVNVCAGRQCLGFKIDFPPDRKAAVDAFVNAIASLQLRDFKGPDRVAGPAGSAS